MCVLGVSCFVQDFYLYSSSWYLNTFPQYSEWQRDKHVLCAGFCPSILPTSLTPSLSPRNRIACWFGSVFQLCTMCFVALRRKTEKYLLILEQKVVKLAVVLRCSVRFSTCPRVTLPLAHWALFLRCTVAFFWYVDFLVLILILVLHHLNYSQSIIYSALCQHTTIQGKGGNF